MWWICYSHTNVVNGISRWKGMRRLLLRELRGCPTAGGAYLVGGGDPAEVGDVGDRAHREAAVDQAVVNKHVGHAE